MPHSRTRSACEGFAVTGFSFGGPCARACAYALPGRVTRAGLISCLAPVDDPVAERGHGAAGEPLDRGTHGGRKDVLEGPALVGHRVPVLSGHQEPERSSGSLAVGRAEWEGVGESGFFEDAVHVRRTASQLELDSSSLRLRVESDDHSQTGGVDEMEPVEVEVDSSQAGRLDCPLERGLDGEGRLHVEIAAQRRDDGVGARGQLDGSRVAGRHVAL
jgi:hypothetical protein